MSENDEAAEKTHDPTPKKLEDARKKGDVPKSVDVTTSAAYLGLIVALMLAAQIGLPQTGAAVSSLFANADTISETVFANGGFWFFGQLILGVLPGLSGLFVIPATFALVALVAQRAIVFAPEKLMFKVNRISPIAGAKNKFGPNGLFEFLKSAVKLVVVAVLLVHFFLARLEELVQTLYFSPDALVRLIGDLLLDFLLLVFVMSLLVGGADYFWQIGEHMRKNRMSRKDLEDEVKNSEGDPYMKQSRRQRGYEIAMNQMLADVPGADVVIVNPTHFAVALKWDRTEAGAPVCVAKGTDEIAMRIREKAADAMVPIHSDPPTARAIFASVDIGQEIHSEHYRPVAAAIRFAEDMRRKAGKRK